MNNQQQFGPWTVEKTIQKNRMFQVSHPNKEGAFILKRERENKKTITNEIEILRRLEGQPNIIQLVDSDLSHETPYHVTRKIKGGNVHEVDFSSYSNKELKRLFERSKKEISDAFGYAHSQGINLTSHVEIIYDEDRKRFIITDLESAELSESHHINASSSFFAVAFFAENVSLRIKVIKEARAKAKAPSAPRRLAAE